MAATLSNGKRSQGQQTPSTLAEAHDVLWHQRPATHADSQTWAAFHRHSASVYARTSAVDPRHRYEALQCAGMEIRKARDIEHRLNPQLDDDEEF